MKPNFVIKEMPYNFRNGWALNYHQKIYVLWN